MHSTFGYIILGIIAGILSGFLGIGGGLIIIPALILIFGLSQHTAQGTTLAIMVPQISLLASYEYYRAGYVNIHTAVFICIGFVAGGWLGARYAVLIPEPVLRKIFGVIMLITSIKLLISR